MNRAWLIAKETMTHVDAYIQTSEGLNEHLDIPLSDVPSILGEGTVQFFCPSEWISFLDIQLPEVKPSLLDAIIPNLVEEMLAEPIETIHWAVAQERQNKEGKTTIAVIQRAHMENMINMFHPVRMTLEAIYPDVYVIPVMEDGWNCWVKGLRMLVRENKFRGLSLRQSESANWFAAMHVPEKTTLYGAGDASNIPPVTAWIEALRTAPPIINLMQGSFEPKSKKSNFNRMKFAW